MAPEGSLITHYQGLGFCAWNGISFGPHDPGRERETTNKPPEGFDAQYPIREDWLCTGIAAGQYNVRGLLKAMKNELPFLLRYVGSQTGGHPDYKDLTITVPQSGMSAEELLRLVTQNLPPGWQATRFQSHMILYKESTGYTHGIKIWPPQ